MDKEKEKTALTSSVDANERQSYQELCNNSIPDSMGNCNTPARYFDDWEQFFDPNYLRTISMSELFDSIYKGKPLIIDGLLYRGTYLFAGAPKVGKSFLMAQLAYHVSTGTPLWKHNVRKGTVLYLALEDDYRRLQSRLFRMFGAAENENLFFSVSAGYLGENLDKQLEGFIRDHKDTSLIIIDTLQKVREIGSDKYSYANDYQVIAKLKEFSDCYGVCLLLVHHTRKQQSDDKFDMISGTNGLLGAADGAFLLAKESRTSNCATLDILGRDQQDQRLHLKRNEETLAWDLERAEAEMWKVPPEPLLEHISKIITKDSPNWSGSPTELCRFLKVEMKPNVLTMKLNVNASRLMNEYGIRYENKRCHDGRKVSLTHEKRDDA